MFLRTRQIVSVAALIAVLSMPATADKKKLGVNMAKKPEQLAQSDAALTNAVSAQRPCDNYGWAAIVETMLKLQNVTMPQQDWVMKSYGGFKCVSPVKSYSDLLRYVNGSYTLEPGRRVRIESEYNEGAPSSADDFILAMREGRAVMLVWNGRPYLWYGVVYDEYIHGNGSRMFEMRELKLFDPQGKTEKERLLSFVKGRDDANQINGVMMVRVSKL